MTEPKKVRINIGTFNLIKGIGMLCIILAHMTARYNQYVFPSLKPMYDLLHIFSTGVLPLFFLISGYTFKNKPAKVMLKKTFSELVVPYLWSALGCIIFFPLLHSFFVEELRDLLSYTQSTIVAFLLGLPNPRYVWGMFAYSVQALWFLLAFFIGLNLLSWILKLKKTVVQILAVVLCFFVGFYLLQYEINFFCIPQGLMAVGYCYTGYMLKQKKLLDRIMSSVWAVAALGAVCLYQASTGEIFAMAAGGFSVMDYCIAGCSGLFFMILGIYSSRCNWKCLNWLKKIGMYSYWIICIHSVEMLSCPWDVLVENYPSLPLAGGFLIEVSLKIVIITTGCVILKKISQYNYKKKRKAFNGT